jgi:HSP20 family protein
MPVRWRRATSRSVRIVSFGGLSPTDLLSVLSSSPMVAPIRWRPATDICETPESITVTVELAGVREEDLDIELYPDAVIVSGSRSPQLCGPEAIYHALEIRHGGFRLEVPLPITVDLEGPEATLENGILRIQLPRGGEPSGSDDEAVTG